MILCVRYILNNNRNSSSWWCWRDEEVDDVEVDEEVDDVDVVVEIDSSETVSFSTTDNKLISFWEELLKVEYVKIIRPEAISVEKKDKR